MALQGTASSLVTYQDVTHITDDPTVTQKYFLRFNGENTSCNIPISLQNQADWEMEFIIASNEMRSNNQLWREHTIIGVNTGGGVSRDLTVGIQDGYLQVMCGLGGSNTTDTIPEGSVLSEIHGDYGYKTPKFVSDGEPHVVKIALKDNKLTLNVDNEDLGYLNAKYTMGNSSDTIYVGLAYPAERIYCQFDLYYLKITVGGVVKGEYTMQTPDTNYLIDDSGNSKNAPLYGTRSYGKYGKIYIDYSLPEGAAGRASTFVTHHPYQGLHLAPLQVFFTYKQDDKINLWEGTDSAISGIVYAYNTYTEHDGIQLNNAYSAITYRVHDKLNVSNVACYALYKMHGIPDPSDPGEEVNNFYDVDMRADTRRIVNKTLKVSEAFDTTRAICETHPVYNLQFDTSRVIHKSIPVYDSYDVLRIVSKHYSIHDSFDTSRLIERYYPVNTSFDTSRVIYKSQCIVYADTKRNVIKQKKLGRDIFQNNARVEHADEGMRFYEQDIVLVTYIYDGDVTIETRVKYNMPGFGIVINSYNEHKTVDDEPMYGLLMKLGDASLSTYQQKFGQLARIHNDSCVITPDEKWHLLRFKKTGLYIYLYEVTDYEEKLIGYYKAKKEELNRFRIGIYSNKDNIVSKFDIYDNRPEFWFTNIQNTNGGRVSFAKDEICVEQAEKDIEIEQECISLPKGRYFFSYKTSPVDNILKADAYIFDSTEDKIHAKEKNLLKYDEKKYGDVPYFDIENEDKKVNLLIQANSALIDDPAIKDDPNQDYVSTEDKPLTKDGSYMILYTDKIKKAEITANVLRVPIFKMDEKTPYSVYTYADKPHTIVDLHVDTNKEYDYTFTLQKDGWHVEISSDGRVVYRATEPLNRGNITFFKDVSGYISRLIVTKRDGTVIDILNQRTSKKYVPATITSPIIVTDKNYEPFDLSASYRQLDDGKYIFTNWEREIFTPTENIYLNSPVNGDNNVILYGIKDELNTDNIYKIRDKGTINDIDYASKSYDILAGDVYSVIDGQNIHLNRNVLKGYTSLVIDYLKRDSYAINLTEDGNEYEVEISTTNNGATVMYDMTQSGEIRTYKILDGVSPADDTYLVLKKDEEI